VQVVDYPGPHSEVPQNEQVRAAIPGQRVSDGQPSTLIVIWSPIRGAWSFYIDSDPGRQVAVAVSEVGPLLDLLRRRGGVR
jgi:hypothetical protein